MLEQRVPQLEQELSDAMTQVNIVRELQQEADKRFAAAKQVTDDRHWALLAYVPLDVVLCEPLHGA